MSADTGSSSEPRDSSRRTLALGLAIVVCAVVLFWWTAVDRLDLPKLAILVLGALGLSIWILVRGAQLRPDPLSLALALAVLVSSALSWNEFAARIEGWAGFVGGLILVLAGRRCGESSLLAWLSRLAIGLACLAWLQAAGLPVFNADLTGLEGRRVVGTLGGPGHLGWTLALLLPWSGAWFSVAGPISKRIVRVRWFGLALVVGALVLSGSRTAWVMGLVGLPFWLGRTRRRAALLALLCGALLAVGLDALARRSRLADRISDLVSESGTASGRIYLWRVYAHNWRELAGLGRGPEGFQRAWPAWQRAYLADHPEQAPFASDLRHAHADPVELVCDFGLPGLGLGLFVWLLALLRPAARSRWRGPALACVVVAAVGGLAAPLLHFAPTLTLSALCLGIRLGEVRRPMPAWSPWVLVLAVTTACVPLAMRVASEIQRSGATLERSMDRPESAWCRALVASQLDARNARAWIELGLAAEMRGDRDGAREAFSLALRDLPLDALRSRLAAQGLKGVSDLR